MLVLKDHQAEAIAHIESEEFGSDLVHAPTGSGKTIIFMKLAHDRLQQKRKTLILVHREHLIKQVLERFNEFYPDDPIGIVRGSSRQWDANIVVASVQTATHDIDIMPTDFSLIITDEAHRAIAPSYFRIYKRLGLINNEVFDELLSQAKTDEIADSRAEQIDMDASGMAEDDPDREVRAKEAKQIRSTFMMAKTQRENILNLERATEGVETHRTDRKHCGFTATPQRTDELGLGVIFTGVAYQCQIRDLIEKNQLCDLRILPVSFRCNKTELRAMLRDGLADPKIVSLWQAKAHDRKSTIGFAMNIDHAEHLSQTFQRADVDARVVHSKLPKEVRHENEEAFRDGRAPVLINVNVFIEGFDVPRLDCIIMARDTDSSTLIPQALGRGTRLQEGKTDCLVLDIGRTIDINLLSKSADIFRKIQYAGNGLPPGIAGVRNVKEGTDHDMIQGAFVELASIIRDADDSLSWVPHMKINGVSLNLARKKWVSIGQHRDNPDLYAAAFEHEQGRKLIAKGKLSIAECKDICLRFLLDNNMSHLVAQREAEWRMNEATAKQKALLEKYGVEVSSDCTRGEASDLISCAIRNST